MFKHWYGRNSQLRIIHPTFLEFELYQSMLYICIKKICFTKTKTTDKIQTIMKWRNDGYGQNHIPQPFQPWHKILTYHKNKRRMGQNAHLRRLLENRLTHMIIKIMIKREKDHYLLYENWMVLHLNKLESPSHSEALCKVEIGPVVLEKKIFFKFLQSIFAIL